MLANTAFQYSIDPRQIQPGSHAELHLSVPLNRGESESLVEIRDELLFEVKDLRILEKTSERTSCCLDLKYVMTGYHDQIFSLPPIEIKTLGNSFSTESVSLTVQSSRGPEDNELRESFSNISKPIPFLKWLRYLAMALGLSALLGYAYKKWKGLPKRIRKSAPPQIPVLVEDPHHWIKKQLAILKAKIEKDPTNEWLVDEWSMIIKEFIFRTKSLPTKSWTTIEIKKALSIDPFVAQLLPSLEKSDRCKFDPRLKPLNKLTELMYSLISETEKNLSLCGNS